MGQDRWEGLAIDLARHGAGTQHTREAPTAHLFKRSNSPLSSTPEFVVYPCLYPCKPAGMRPGTWRVWGRVACQLLHTGAEALTMLWHPQEKRVEVTVGHP